jgi:hypothetical protein
MSAPHHDLDQRLRAYIAWMAPHQKDREGGKLLIEAAAEIQRLKATLERVAQVGHTGSAIPEWAATEIRNTWSAARDSGGELQAFRIIERMVDRLGYGRTQGNLPLFTTEGQQ